MTARWAHAHAAGQPISALVPAVAKLLAGVTVAIARLRLSLHRLFLRESAADRLPAILPALFSG
jgi:hypothetical protein